MKKYILLLVTVLFLSQIVISQKKSLVKNKLAIEYELSISPKTNELDHLTFSQQLKSTKYFNTLFFNYQIRSKIALSLLVGFHRNDLTLRYGYYDNNKESYSNEPTYIKGNEIGLGLKFYFRNHRAPLGNSFDVYLKRQSFKIDKDDLGDYINMDYSLNMTLLGVKLNFITMISPKLPIYFKSSVSVFAPLLRTQVIPTYKPNSIAEDDINLSNNGGSEDDYSMVSNYRNINWFKIHIGLGYAF